MVAPNTAPDAARVQPAPAMPGDAFSRRLVTNPWEQRWKKVWDVVTYNRLAMAGFLLIGIFVVIGIIGPFVAPYDPQLMAVGGPAQPPSPQHWFGTTLTGQDLFSQFLVGTRTSLIVGFTVGVLSTALAVLIGSIAGYLGGWMDDFLTLIMNVFLTIPTLPLLIVIASYAATFHLRGLSVIIVILTLTGWAWGARVKRSQVLSLRNKDFVMAARVSGEHWFRILAVEVLPNMLSLIASTLIFGVIFAVLTEASLEFLGLGDLTTTTWGTTLYWAENSSALLTGMWWWFMPPGVAVGLFATGLVLINYTIDEMTNPRLRVQRQRKGGGVVPQMTSTAPHDTARSEGMADVTPA